MPLVFNGTGSISGISDTGLDDVVNDGLFIKNLKTVTSSVTLSGSYNWGTFGPTSIANGITVTIGSGGTWSIV